MKITFEQTSKKKRRWRGIHALSSLSWFSKESCDALETTLFTHNPKCRVLKEAIIFPTAYQMIVEFKNDSDEAAFMLWASGGIEI